MMGFHGRESKKICLIAIGRYHHHSIDACVQDEGSGDLSENGKDTENEKKWTTAPRRRYSTLEREISGENDS